MANQKRDSTKESKWREILKRQQTSGLSVRAFCRQEAIREPSFYAWRRTIRQRDAKNQPAATDAFVPAVVSELPLAPAGEPILVELSAGVTLRLPQSISTTWVAQLVQALDARGDQCLPPH